MSLFNKLLLAVDLNAETDSLLRRVEHLCLDNMDCVHVVHVLRCDVGEHSASTDAIWDDLEMRRLRDQAIQRLNDALRRNGIDVSIAHLHVCAGEPAYEIKRLAHEIEADLVIVGSHCKKGGWLDLPGATTNCVLQGIHSDVMAVRV